MKHLNVQYPIYVDFTSFYGMDYQFVNVKSLDLDKMNIKLTMENDEIKNISLVGCSYIGFGTMEDLVLGVHLPITFYK